jgi:hypothetical protein
MKIFWFAIAIACDATPALAQDFPGAALAGFYSEEMSIPKGWKLSYEGQSGGAEVFIMDRDLDTCPQTAFLQPIDQVRRLMCDPEMGKQFMTGRIIRVDMRDLRAGKKSRIKGEELSSC